jgi:GT2 family glycosyltransferase
VSSVCAVVVTHNRRELLVHCLAALRAQTSRPDRVLVVDNASTDGTADLVRREFADMDLLALARNEGGAGGFHEGMRAAHAAGAEWIWLMDDDTPAALAPRRPLLLSSRAVWTDGRLHPMNEPTFRRDMDALVDGCERGLLPLRQATFVSLLVHRDAVERHGLPHKHFFIWSDDIEYTGRVLRDGPHGYFVPDSVVEHRTRSPHTAVTASGDRYYFHVRNTLYMLRGDAWEPFEKLSLLWSLAYTTQAYLRLNRFARGPVRTVLRGLRDGIRPAPPRAAPARRRGRGARPSTAAAGA